VKNLLWKMLVRLAGLMPSALRRLVIRLMAEADAQRADARAALCDLCLDLDAVHAVLDRTAIRHGGGLHPKHRLIDYHRFFIDKTQPGDRILDVGCGLGAVANSLAQAGRRVTAVDISAEHVRNAQARYQHENLSFQVADATREVSPGPYRSVVLSNVLEHIEHRIPFLTQLVDVAKPHSILIRVPAFNRDWLVPLKKELGLWYFSDPTHYIEYTRDTFEGEMKAAGLTIQSLDSLWGEIWAEVLVPSANQQRNIRA
jgi:2-polyprenyl-3-methyl-5-hydroxy-6-metoxy-1,4-benzoquinol methylase